MFQGSVEAAELGEHGLGSSLAQGPEDMFWANMLRQLKKVTCTKDPRGKETDLRGGGGAGK